MNANTIGKKKGDTVTVVNVSNVSDDLYTYVFFDKEEAQRYVDEDIHDIVTSNNLKPEDYSVDYNNTTVVFTIHSMDYWYEYAVFDIVIQ